MDTAITAYQFVQTHMSQNGRLHHVWCDGKADHPATLDDYAQMARAALVLFETTMEPGYLADAKTWVGVLNQHYWDQTDGAYYLSADDTTDTIVRPKTAQANAVPAGNGTMAEVLARLFHITGDGAYETRANDLISALTPEEPQASLHHPALMCGFELLANPSHVIIIGTADDPHTQELHRNAYLADDPNLIVTVKSPGDTLPHAHPAHGKEAINGQATAYICKGVTCSLPVTHLEDLISTLKG